jgi:hypothetical protein
MARNEHMTATGRFLDRIGAPSLGAPRGGAFPCGKALKRGLAPTRLPQPAVALSALVRRVNQVAVMIDTPACLVFDARWSGMRKGNDNDDEIVMAG